MRMALRAAAELAQRHRLLGLHDAERGPGRVERRRGVAFGENETVAVARKWRFGIDPKLAAVERGHDVGARERAARVARRRVIDRGDRDAADFAGVRFEARDEFVL